MDQIPSYNLLQAIDPTKIKVPISERFAKLTLSSNKKQQQNCGGTEQQEELKKHQEKRDSVTRNISKLFDIENQPNKTELGQNPLLRSESSKETDNNNSIDAADVTMEPLVFSDDDDNNLPQVEDDLELLSQQIASMTVKSKPISLSSSSTGNLSIFTDLISSESQRSSSSEINNIHIVHNIPINVSEAVKLETIPLNLISSTNSNVEKTYEMTDEEDEEDDDEEEDEVITISDTSESNHEQEQDIMTTSNLTSKSLTSENLSIPSFMDNKAERVAAFLRDVSIEQRAMVNQGQVDFYDTIDQILDNNEIDKIQETLSKSRQMATIDTESMTPDGNEEATPKYVLERENRLKVLEDSIELEEGKQQKVYTEIKGTPKIQSGEQFVAKNMHRLAYDETLDNTVMTEAEGVYERITTPHKRCGSKIAKSREEDAYKIANDETQCNTDYSISEETPKISTQIKKQNTRNSHRLVDLDTEENTECSMTEKSLTHKSHMDSCRPVNEKIVANSTMPDFEEALTQQSQDYKTPDKESTFCSSVSINSTLLSSVINSSNEINDTVPDNSLTVLETDDENVQQGTPEKNENCDDQKLSNSFHREDSSDDSHNDRQKSQIQMSIGSINISAKINIKIHIPITTSTDTSEDDQNYRHDNEDNKGSCKGSDQLPEVPTDEQETVDNNRSADSKEQNVESHSPQNPCNQMQLKAPVEKIASSPNKSSDSVEDEKFLTEAQKLLTQLYGNAWQTPDVIRTLKRTTQSGDKKANNSKSYTSKKTGIMNSTEKKSSKKSTVQENMLDDFSIFRRDIVKTNLDSTRLAMPKKAMQNKQISSEPRNWRKPMRQTEQSPVDRYKGRANKDRWQQLIDSSNSEGDNASDDDDADKSWSKNASELELENSDSDFENSPVPKARKRNKRQARSDKSDYLTKILNKSKDGEIVYLDLTKEEVEVQDEVPESPPANHDVTFATRLQDILKSCRHEDKTKLPSSNQKTKRKLFTPNFGDDDEEVASSKGYETKSKENTDKETKKRDDNVDEILEDSGNCPFDIHGRPKIFELVNKRLESVKTGKPIFQLTPPSKKKDLSSSSNKKSDKNANVKSDCGSTPKTKLDKEAIFKTPLTLKSKGLPKALRELYQTPDYKYSFLKSLDVTVSKTLCHPDALYYRDNYRIKKEDLSKILYDMYNEKLFQYKLNVPLKWNKKLLNTAGRCLNKKSLGIRSSIIELSDKVLTSADRLRCTLIHELCHAATWIFNGEGGHGNSWKEWARRANSIFPEIPKIGVCHQYDIEYKYTYKCTLCGAKSHAHSKSKKVENIRCSYCHGAIEIFLNKKDKDGHLMPTPVKEATGFAKFVKDNYKKFKRDDLKHADVMKLLSSEFASLKVSIN